MSDEKAVPVDPETAAEAAEGADVDDEKKLQTREAAEQDSALGKLTDRVSSEWHTDLLATVHALTCILPRR